MANKPGQGALFNNKDNKRNPNSPDYSGSITTPDGQEFYLSAWIKESKQPGGKKFMSLSMTAKSDSGQQHSGNTAPNKDIPF